MSDLSLQSRLLALWTALDRRLLLNRPQLWTMRFHHAVALGLAATLVCVLIAWSVPVSTANIPNIRPFFLSWLSLSVVASLYWTWLQFRVLRHVSVRGPDGGGRTFGLYLVCLAAINLAPLTATAVLQQRIVAAQGHLEEDLAAFTQGVETVDAYSEANGTYRCDQPSEHGWGPDRLCPAKLPHPRTHLGDTCGEWASHPGGHATVRCNECSQADDRVARLAPVIERYGCARAPSNLKNAQIAAGLGSEEAGFNRRFVFALWFVSVVIATVLTILRTTPGRLVLEVALVLGGIWFALTFAFTAFGVFQGWSQPVALVLCAAGVLAALTAYLVGPHAVLQRLLAGTCLLAGLTAVACAQAMFDQNESVLGAMDIEHSINWFASPWQGRPSDPFFLVVLAAGTVAAGTCLTLYRALAQRLAARPVKR